MGSKQSNTDQAKNEDIEDKDEKRNALSVEDYKGKSFCQGSPILSINDLAIFLDRTEWLYSLWR